MVNYANCQKEKKISRAMSLFALQIRLKSDIFNEDFEIR
jgi:hypothetical protein